MTAAEPIDPDAVIRQCFALLWRYFNARCEGEAEDLIQQTFVRYFETVGRSGPVRHPRAYVLRIARSVLFSYYRRRAAFDPICDTLPAVGPGLSSAFAQRQQDERLRGALSRLPFSQFEILELYYGEQMRGPVLSAVLGIPQGTVRSRLRRAKRRLLEELDREQPRIDPGDRNRP